MSDIQITVELDDSDAKKKIEALNKLTIKPTIDTSNIAKEINAALGKIKNITLPATVKVTKKQIEAELNRFRASPILNVKVAVDKNQIQQALASVAPTLTVNVAGTASGAAQTRRRRQTPVAAPTPVTTSIAPAIDLNTLRQQIDRDFKRILGTNPIILPIEVDINRRQIQRALSRPFTIDVESRVLPTPQALPAPAQALPAPTISLLTSGGLTREDIIRPLSSENEIESDRASTFASSAAATAATTALGTAATISAISPNTHRDLEDILAMGVRTYFERVAAGIQTGREVPNTLRGRATNQLPPIGNVESIFERSFAPIIKAFNDNIKRVNSSFSQLASNSAKLSAQFARQRSDLRGLLFTLQRQQQAGAAFQLAFSRVTSQLRRSNAQASAEFNASTNRATPVQPLTRQLPFGSIAASAFGETPESSVTRRLLASDPGINRSRLSGATTTELPSALKALTTATDSSTSATRNSTSTTKRLTDEQRKTGGYFQTLGRALVILSAFAPIFAAFAAVAATVGGSFRGEQRTTGAINQLGVVAEGSQLLDITTRASEIAIDTRAEFSQTARVLSRVVRSTDTLGLSLNQISNITSTVNKSLQLSGSSVQEASAGAIQLSQGLASGRLQGDELRSVLENTPALALAIVDGINLLPPALTGLRRGVTANIGTLRELSKQGRLTGEVVSRALLLASTRVDEQFKDIRVPILDSATDFFDTLFNLIGADLLDNRLSEYIQGLTKDLKDANAEVLNSQVLVSNLQKEATESEDIQLLGVSNIPGLADQVEALIESGIPLGQLEEELRAIANITPQQIQKLADENLGSPSPSVSDIRELLGSFGTTVFEDDSIADALLKLINDPARFRDIAAFLGQRGRIPQRLSIDPRTGATNLEGGFIEQINPIGLEAQRQLFTNSQEEARQDRIRDFRQLTAQTNSATAALKVFNRTNTDLASLDTLTPLLNSIQVLNSEEGVRKLVEELRKIAPAATVTEAELDDLLENFDGAITIDVLVDPKRLRFNEFPFINRLIAPIVAPVEAVAEENPQILADATNLSQVAKNNQTIYQNAFDSQTKALNTARNQASLTDSNLSLQDKINAALGKQSVLVTSLGKLEAGRTEELNKQETILEAARRLREQEILRSTLSEAEGLSAASSRRRRRATAGALDAESLTAQASLTRFFGLAEDVDKESIEILRDTLIGQRRDAQLIIRQQDTSGRGIIGALKDLEAAADFNNLSEKIANGIRPELVRTALNQGLAQNATRARDIRTEGEDTVINFLSSRRRTESRLTATLLRQGITTTENLDHNVVRQLEAELEQQQEINDALTRIEIIEQSILTAAQSTTSLLSNSIAGLVTNDPTVNSREDLEDTLRAGLTDAAQNLFSGFVRSQIQQPIENAFMSLFSNVFEEGDDIRQKLIESNTELELSILRLAEQLALQAEIERIQQDSSLVDETATDPIQRFLKQNEALQEARDRLEALRSDSSDRIEEIQESLKNIRNPEDIANLGNQLKEGFTDIVNSFKDNIGDLGRIFTSGIGSLGSVLGSVGGTAGSFLGTAARAAASFIGLPLPFNQGGSFEVGGAAGIDRNFVPLRLTRGERVDITPANGNNGNGVNIINTFDTGIFTDYVTSNGGTRTIRNNFRSDKELLRALARRER